MSAASCFHLYCSTKHCAAPCAFMVILLHSRTSAAFLAADLKQARVDAVTAAASQAFVQRIGNLQGAGNWHGRALPGKITDRVGFEPTVPLRAHRFSRPAVSTAHAPVLETVARRRLHVARVRRQGPDPRATGDLERATSKADRVGFEPTKRLPVYTLSR